MSDLLRLQDALIKAQRWKEAKTVTAAIATITKLRVENLRLLGDHVRCPKCGEAYTLNSGRAAALKEKTDG